MKLRMLIKVVLEVCVIGFIYLQNFLNIFGKCISKSIMNNAKISKNAITQICVINWKCKPLMKFDTYTSIAII